MKKTILVVNLRRLTKEAYISLNAIKTLGFSILLMSKTLPAYYQEIVDDFVSADPSQYEATIALSKTLAKKFHILGVVAFTETAVEIVSYIAQALGLPGNPVEAVRFSRDKLAMRQHLASQAVEQVSHLHLKHPKGLHAHLNTLEYPVIIKPINASGSTGIFHLTGPEDAETFFNNTQHISNPSYDPFSKKPSTEFIMEKYIEGSEVSVEGLIFNREVLICGITDKLTTDQYKIEYQHIFPSGLSSTQQDHIKTAVKQIIHALGFNDCSFHLEGKLTPTGFYLIEVATRPAGGYIASHLLPITMRANYYEDLVRIAVGMRPKGGYQAHCHAGVRFVLAREEGLFRAIAGWEHLSEHPLIHSVFLETAFGSTIMLPPKDFRSIRLFAFIASAFSYQEVDTALSQLAKRIIPMIEKVPETIQSTVGA